ncbi:MAG: hypothetical protein M3452_09475 [Chloroflexota bacterium]|nr:hypothetical protein [Chloroflexota bacterium]
MIQALVAEVEAAGGVECVFGAACCTPFNEIRPGVPRMSPTLLAKCG